MSQQRDQRHSRDERSGYGGRRQEEQEARYRDQRSGEHERSRRFGRGGSERFGGEGSGGHDEYGRDGWRSGEADRELGRGGGFGARGGEFGRGGEEDFRDYSRDQPGGAYEHAGERGYRHGGGYGGYGRQPGEAGGGFSSGQSYASEPGWGPGYGGEGRERLASEGPGSFPGSYGAQAQRGYDGRGSYGQEQGQGREQERYADWGRSQGSSGQPQSGQGFGQGQYGQNFGEAGRRYGEQGFGQSRHGYGPERQRRAGRGPKGYQRSDERLKEDICERLMNADYIDASDVSVEVKDGKVTLEGTVPQRRMKHAIEDIVDDCIGVKDIDNKMRVSQGEENRSETKTSIGSSQSSGGRA